MPEITRICKGRRGRTITVSSARSQDGKRAAVPAYTLAAHPRSQIAEARSRFSSVAGAGEEGSAAMRVVLLGTVHARRGALPPRLPARRPAAAGAGRQPAAPQLSDEQIERSCGRQGRQDEEDPQGRDQPHPGDAQRRHDHPRRSDPAGRGEEGAVRRAGRPGIQLRGQLAVQCRGLSRQQADRPEHGAGQRVAHLAVEAGAPSRGGSTT